MNILRNIRYLFHSLLQSATGKKMEPAKRTIAAILLCILCGIAVTYWPVNNAPPAHLADDPDSPAIGNPYGRPVIVVVFSDYHCGPCKELSTDLEAFTREDTHLRVIFKEYPVLGENSVLAAKSALAVHFANERKYFAYHQALMQSSERFTEAELEASAVGLGIASEAYRKALQDPRIEEQIHRNYQLSNQLYFSAVPTVVVGGKVLVGNSIERIRAAVAQTRSDEEKTVTAPAAR